MNARRHLPALLVASLAAGCVQSESIDPMMLQPKYKAYARNDFYLDGRAMRVPPANTIPRERVVGNLALTTGTDEQGKILTAIPVKLTHELLLRGQAKFNIYCASQMSLRPPPNLHERASQPVGHTYEVIANGYGLMPSYAADLTVDDRWAVVAYVRALQRSQAAKLSDAPPAVRSELSKESP